MLGIGLVKLSPLHVLGLMQICRVLGFPNCLIQCFLGNSSARTVWLGHKYYIPSMVRPICPCVGGKILHHWALGMAKLVLTRSRLPLLIVDVAMTYWPESLYCSFPISTCNLQLSSHVFGSRHRHCYLESSRVCKAGVQSNTT